MFVFKKNFVYTATMAGKSMEFCSGCAFYNTEIAPDMLCARAALDAMHAFLGALGDRPVFVLASDGSATKSTTALEGTSYDAVMSEPVLACIEQVSQGHEPINLRQWARDHSS